MNTISLSTQYVTVHCGPPSSGGCNLPFAMTRDFYNETKRTGQTWYCPNGHPRAWSGPTDTQKLEAANAKLTAQQDQLESAIREAETVRVALLRDRQRFANGVCPCCNRSFENVRRHMATKHPDYDTTIVTQHQPRSFRCGCGQAFETLRGLRIHQGHARTTGWDRPGASAWRAHLTRV